ncbi:RNA recognition motif domain-containing protein [Mucilaginibacter sp. E4BP6]|jgi:RNA recognition motif-containing protein|uniref:RNA recognition motif domain-containing protein n=1 Tax=Mucilaginibacter sp. E4BP6 TaxID=2723089 RepID=UPI0015CDD277|nr:RNA-binding protein [Mucilaginibacter sp. E4BP6]NYE65842.1 RNA recognition motif-containing protein [Mucilaginibacter sp. E4BP6]
MTKLFVVGFPRDMDKTELLELFSLHGLVDLVTVITDKETGVSQGYGFIHMNDEAGADRAIAALNGAEIDDRKITVRVADTKPEPPKPVYQPQRPAAKGKRPRRGQDKRY